MKLRNWLQETSCILMSVYQMVKVRAVNVQLMLSVKIMSQSPPPTTNLALFWSEQRTCDVVKRSQAEHIFPQKEKFQRPPPFPALCFIQGFTILSMAYITNLS